MGVWDVAVAGSSTDLSRATYLYRLATRNLNPDIQPGGPIDFHQYLPIFVEFHASPAVSNIAASNASLAD
jgi:hypothetical protein